MKLALILIHYHTPELVEQCVEALRRDAEHGGLDILGLLVDNGSRPRDRETLRSTGFRLLEPGKNLGYAAGFNLGVAEAGRADAYVVINPDVQVLPGCLQALATSLEEGAAAAGPRFYWDGEKTFLLPPTQRRSRLEELLEVFSSRSTFLAGAARRRWRRPAHRFWMAHQSYPCEELSGALLAIRRDAWQRVGPFDEGYALYFEETDWLRRCVTAGLQPYAVPEAEAIHLYAQSASREPKAQEWFEASYTRFLEKHYGPSFARLLQGMASHLPISGRHEAAWKEISPGLISCPEPSGWLELSPRAEGYPAAGKWLREGLPHGVSEELQGQLGVGSYYLRAVSSDGRESQLGAFKKMLD